MRHLLFFLATAVLLFAHVGSPDIFYEGDAGPYHLLVAIRPPVVIPGVAEVEVREVHVVPLPLKGPGAKFAPTPDLAKRSKDDPQFYTGGLWMMQFGSWQVRVQASGDKGTGEISIPVPALAVRTSTMQKGIGTILFGLTLFLVIGLVSIVGTEDQGSAARAWRSARRKESEAPRRRRNGSYFRPGVFAGLPGQQMVGFGGRSFFARHIYKPVQMSGTVSGGTPGSAACGYGFSSFEQARRSDSRSRAPHAFVRDEQSGDGPDLASPTPTANLGHSR